MKDSVKFLIVDDREENLVSLEALLRRDGLEILMARSGEQALELLLRHEVALAILDVQMPTMDGFELAELMRGSARSRHVPIIFVTADPSERHRVFQGYDAGAVDFLVKPVDPRILHHKAQTFFELARQRQELAETLRFNEMFVAAIGHDLRDPLNAFVICTERIVRESKEPSTLAVAERLRSSARRMTRMIDELFDLSRARLASGIPIAPQPTNMLAIARRVVAEYQSANPLRRIELSDEGSLDGEWDPTRIEQVISNLVGNAVKHGAPECAVRVRIVGGASQVVLEVTNDGAIPPELLPNIFDPFRSRRSGSRADGLGLGLYIVRELADAHGGDVSVRSSASEGTTFTVRLPTKAPAARARSASTIASPSSQADRSSSVSRSRP